MADENVGLDLASQTGQEDIVEAINGLKNLLSRLSDLLTLGSKTVTQNGIYNPADDGFDGYSQVDVNIQLYTNDTTYESEVKIDDVSGFTKLYSTTIPYGSSGSKVSTQLSVTDENSIETLMNNGWESGAFYNLENQIGAYAGYSFGRNVNITKCKIWLGRYSGQNISLYATIQYLNDNDEWVDLETLDISTTIPYPVNVFEIAIERFIRGIRWIHKEEPQKSGGNNICFFGMTLYENVSGSEGVNVYKPTRTGLIAPPEGYAGFGNLLIQNSGNSSIFPSDVIRQFYQGDYKTYTCTQDGYYLVLAILDGYSSSTLTYTTDAEVVKAKESSDTSDSTWGSHGLFLVLSAVSGQTITVQGSGISRQKMIVIYLTSLVKDFSDITALVVKDGNSQCALNVTPDVNKKYTLCFAGSTADYSPTAKIESDNEVKFEVINDNKIHIVQILEGKFAASLQASGTSYAANYCGYFTFNE